MYTIVTYDCKFKINQEYIENILQHYGLRKIQSSLYWGFVMSWLIMAKHFHFFV